jgi:hypothetical protein
MFIRDTAEAEAGSRAAAFLTDKLTAVRVGGWGLGRRFNIKTTKRQTPKTWGRGGQHHPDSRKDQGREKRQLVPINPKPHWHRAFIVAPWGLWSRGAARLGRDGTAGGQEAQHHKMAQPEVGARRAGKSGLETPPKSLKG